MCYLSLPLFSCSVLFIVYVYKAENHKALFKGILLASQILVALMVMFPPVSKELCCQEQYTPHSVRKYVFGVSDKGIPKPACSATDKVRL